MAKKNIANIENSVQTWRELSLILLLILGIVGALSYVLLFRQKDQLLLQEVRINRLQEQVEELQKKNEDSMMMKK